MNQFFVYGSSDINILRIPFFLFRKDPLEEFDPQTQSPSLAPASVIVPTAYISHWLLLMASTSDSIFFLHLQTSTVRDATNSTYSLTSTLLQLILFCAPSGSATPTDPSVVSTAGLDSCLQQLIACS
ncbi:hypothetical protein F511_28461 [Dorcoceras hygrometricum]|uniref:Uncharacterized protein n=1 Tax=Dorcoceras hygrometricum TaxID=472368 RepID=A0A2Z7CDP0_9LAMI|nr:hypothetical protein F511_28461 [Dorcoceras hygrometricum]